jgi:hypothetical protein
MSHPRSKPSANRKKCGALPVSVNLIDLFHLYISSSSYICMHGLIICLVNSADCIALGDRMIRNNELVGKLRDGAVAKFKLLSMNLPEGSGENYENFSQDS